MAGTKKKDTDFTLGKGMAENARKKLRDRRSELDRMLDDMEQGKPTTPAKSYDKKKKSS